MSILSFVNTHSNLNLKNDEIHIWLANLDQNLYQLGKLLQTLSIDEQRKAYRFNLEKDRQRFIISIGILRSILGEYLNVEPNKLEFYYEKRGKPVITSKVNMQRIKFNMSHTEGFALYGFIKNSEIGVDIECIRDIPEMEQIAQQIFSKREYDMFYKLPENKKKEAFFRCWTCKEAFLKAIGEGLYYPLDHLEVSLIPGEPAQLLKVDGDKESASRWMLETLKFGTELICAFAVEKKKWSLFCAHWPT